MAVYGLRVRNSSGYTTLEPSDRLTNIQGVVSTGGSDGSVALDASDGTPFFFLGFLPHAQVGDDGALVAMSNIHIYYSAGRVYWEYDDTGTNYDTDIIYGVF